MAAINPYLNFNGNTEEAFNFYRSVFGGEFLTVMRFKDTPETAHVPEKDQDKIMHIALPIGKNILMATDALESAMGLVTAGTNISISIDADNLQEAETLYNALANGGKTTLPLHQAFWGAHFGMLDDKFGIAWMISFDPNSKK